MMFNYGLSPYRNSFYQNKYKHPFYSNSYHSSYQPLNKVEYSKQDTNENDTLSGKNRIEKEEKQFISILGINLYFDDLIILTLLFFLYNEGVKDDGLFICLILLLLS